jgi:hypothetical protein
MKSPLFAPSNRKDYLMKLSAISLSLGLGLLGFTACDTIRDSGSDVEGFPGFSLPQPAAVELDGKVYSRIVHSDGLFGQPATDRTHSVKFLEGGLVMDNASTFFGNPPETNPYALEGRDVVISHDGEEVDRYTLSDDGLTLTNGAGAVLTLEATPAPADAPVTAALEQAEISEMIKLIDRVQVPVSSNGACTVQTADIKSVTRSFNPAKWTIAFDGKVETLTATEASAMAQLFGRLAVRAVARGIDLTSVATINSKVCGFSPANWSATYLKAE